MGIKRFLGETFGINDPKFVRENFQSAYHSGVFEGYVIAYEDITGRPMPESENEKVREVADRISRERLEIVFGSANSEDPKTELVTSEEFVGPNRLLKKRSETESLKRASLS